MYVCVVHLRGCERGEGDVMYVCVVHLRGCERGEGDVWYVGGVTVMCGVCGKW